MNRNPNDTQLNSHYSLQHAHFVLVCSCRMGGSDGRAKSVDFWELLGRGCYIDYFGGGGAALGHYHDRARVATGSDDGVLSVYVMVGCDNARVVFTAAWTG